MRKIALGLILGILVFPLQLFAGNYGAGSYNAGLYSATSESSETPTTPTPSSSGIVTGSMPGATSPYYGCTASSAFSPLTGKPCLGQPTTTIPTTPTTPTPSSTPSASILTVSRNLSWKMRGEDVRIVQQYLNTHGYPVAPSGVGSLGKETTYFGLATKAALIKWQKAHAILPATGTFGPKSKAFVKTNQ